MKNINKKVCDINRIADNLINNIINREKRPIMFEKEYDYLDIILVEDETVSQILESILTNSINALVNNKKLKIKLETENLKNMIIIRIWDNRHTYIKGNLETQQCILYEKLNGSLEAKYIKDQGLTTTVTIPKNVDHV